MREGKALFLAGDIGGTKALLELGTIEGGRWSPLRSARLKSQDFPSLEALLEHFLSGERPQGVSLGVAGPVVEGRCRFTHLGWVAEEGALSRFLGGAEVKLLNDLEAAGWALLRPEGIAAVPLQEGRPRRGNRAIIAAGTGLGEALLLKRGDKRWVQPTEGGHCDFAPTTPLQLELLSWLWQGGFERVSFDDLLSGRGLEQIYRFLAARSGALVQPLPAPEVSQRALGGEDRIAEEALGLWCEIYGAEGGNLVLKGMALGGLYVAGGIAPKVRPFLERHFVPAFLRKGRFRELLAQVPVWLILEEALVLCGARRWLLERERRRNRSDGRDLDPGR